MRKKLYLIFRILLIILIFATIYILLDFHYTNLINKELARIKNLGEPLTLRDINKPENFINAFKKHKDKINEDLKAYKLVFEMLKLAYEKPKCRYNLDYKAGFNMKILNFMSCRNISSTVGFKAVSLILENKPEKAVEILAHGLKFARSITIQHTLIEEMIKIAMESHLIIPLEYMLEKNIKTNYKLVLNEIEAILKEQKTSFTKSLMGERIMGLNVYENPAEFYRTFILSGDPEDIKTLIKLNQFLTLLIKADELFYLKYYKQAIEDARADRILAAPELKRAFINHKKNLQKFSKLKQNLEKL
ncbi:MAG: hypothetical protein HYU63_05380 [Armatimonadetes bacterium]|nr:hypothetical protein [Armatimonadota bacterium]